METEKFLSELNQEHNDLQAELKIINKHLENKKKMHNDFLKELLKQKDELEKLITEVEIEIEIARNELKPNQDGNTNNNIN